jgi:hypothetical protein
MGSIPCHFLADSNVPFMKTGFIECRAFPHLHEEDNFKGRLLNTGTLRYVSNLQCCRRAESAGWI